MRWLLMGDGHMHQWKRIAQGAITSKGIAVGDYYNCECAVCGNIKMFRCV